MNRRGRIFLSCGLEGWGGGMIAILHRLHFKGHIFHITRRMEPKMCSR